MIYEFSTAPAALPRKTDLIRLAAIFVLHIHKTQLANPCSGMGDCTIGTSWDYWSSQGRISGQASFQYQVWKRRTNWPKKFYIHGFLKWKIAKFVWKFTKLFPSWFLLVFCISTQFLYFKMIHVLSWIPFILKFLGRIYEPSSLKIWSKENFNLWSDVFILCSFFIVFGWKLQKHKTLFVPIKNLKNLFEFSWRIYWDRSDFYF